MDTRKSIEKINKTESWVYFFFKIITKGKSLARFTRKK